jgi:hypothetical protein
MSPIEPEKPPKPERKIKPYIPPPPPKKEEPKNDPKKDDQK